MNKKIILSVTSLVMAISSGFAHAQQTPKTADSYLGVNYPIPQVNENKVKPVGLNDLMSSGIKKRAKKSDDVSELRAEALTEIGFSVGSSSGLVYRMDQIKNEINKESARLDNIFDFRRVTIDNGVLAPVLTEGLSNYAKESDDEVRIADKIYKIESPAKFVSVYPTWRSYLIFAYPAHDIPPQSYLPKTDGEREIWDAAIKKGWANGVEQANNIFENSYNRLERDYNGMIKYKMLLAQGLITPTIVAKQNMGVTGGGSEMSINDQLFMITDHSALNPNKNEWKVEYPVTNNVDGILK